MSAEFKYHDDCAIDYDEDDCSSDYYEDYCSIDYYEVLGVQPESTRAEIYKAFRKISLMPRNWKSKSCNAVDVEKIELLKRAKEVLTSTKLKKAYDTRRANKIRYSLSARQNGSNTTSFNEWVNSCSDTSQIQLSDSDLSSRYTSAESGGKCAEKYQPAESESECTTSLRFYRDGYLLDHTSHDVKPEAPTAEWRKTEKNEIKSKPELIKNAVNRIFKERQRTSNLNQDKPEESLSRKRNLSSSSSCSEKPRELKTLQKSPPRKKKNNKKKQKSSIIKRLFQRLKDSRT